LSNIWRCALIVDRRFPTIAIVGALIGLSAVSVSAQQMNRPDLKSPNNAQLPRPSSSIVAVAPTNIPDALRPNRFTPQLVSTMQSKTAVFARLDQVPPVQSAVGQVAAMADPLAGRPRPEQATKIERVQAPAVPATAPLPSQIQ
jgi:hypothetical protein